VKLTKLWTQINKTGL